MLSASLDILLCGKTTLVNFQDDYSNFPDFYGTSDMSHVTRKPVFGVCDQLRLEPTCLADETS